MRVKFTKMHGTGNDFVVIDAVNQKVELTSELAQQIADRHFGIGCDQILLVQQPTSVGIAFRYRILNADGSEVSQCGNGARCFARYVVDKGMIHEREFSVETASGVMIPKVLDDGLVRVNMGVPVFLPERIPFIAETSELLYNLKHKAQEYRIAVVSMGNPHAVLQVENVDTAPVLQLGPELEVHEAFPERANIGFMQVQSRSQIRLRVFERGVGETLACGSGACAAVVAGIRQSLLNDKVAVEVPGGRLQIEWKGVGKPVFLTGPTQNVFEGIIEL